MKKFFIFLIMSAIVSIVALLFFFSRPVSYTGTVSFQEGDGFYRLSSRLSTLDQYKFKRYRLFHDMPTSNIAVGMYRFSGEYSIPDFMHVLEQGPLQKYVSFTVLEGRSMYDIDHALATQGYIKTGAFIDYVTDDKIITDYISRFDRLSSFKPAKLRTFGLEGFLYPETYYLDLNKDVNDQLVVHQLKTFEERVRTPYQKYFLQFTDALHQKGFVSLILSPWAVINLAAVIEKEERISHNRPEIAGVFLNRLYEGMQLGADITICYGLQLLHTECTPAVIADDLKNKKNLYNTRVHIGLPPSPIGNPTLDSIKAVLFFQSTTNRYYLHDSNGNIHFGKNLQEHNFNKSKYLH